MIAPIERKSLETPHTVITLGDGKGYAVPMLALGMHGDKTASLIEKIDAETTPATERLKLGADLFRHCLGWFYDVNTVGKLLDNGCILPAHVGQLIEAVTADPDAKKNLETVNSTESNGTP